MAASTKKIEPAKITLLNQTTMPVVYTVEGHLVGGGERCAVEKIDDIVRPLIEQGYLVEVSEQGKQAQPEQGSSGAPDQEDRG